MGNEPVEPTPTPDGSATLWSERYGQHYHNRHGALTQSRHVFLQGTLTDTHPAPCVLEIGFGAGMNFLTTLENVAERGAPLHYIAYEFDPLPLSSLRVIGATHPANNHPAWQALLTAWSEASSSVLVKHGAVHVEIHFVDATDPSVAAFPEHWASAIYLDGFSPAVNPEVWAPAFIARLATALQANAWLATYSSAGDVRRALQGAGLKVTRRPGMAGKREFLQAWKEAGSRT